MLRLSVIVPVYNECRTLPIILADVLKNGPATAIELIVVDDGSTDGTREWLSSFVDARMDQVLPIALNDAGEVVIDQAGEESGTCQVHFMDRNRGKGAALRAGFELASHEVFVIQDADLEYDPVDIGRMWPLITDRGADVVYGSRFYGQPHRSLYLHHYAANRLISNLVNILCNTTLSDIEVCYKMFRREVIDSMTLSCNDFGIEVEMTVKTLRPKKWSIYEIGIAYYGRTYDEGKKINWRDGVKALWYVLKYRFSS